MKNISVIVASLERAPALVVPLVREVPQAILKRRPRPGKWSAHEHACHLATIHPVMFARLDLMLTEAEDWQRTAEHKEYTHYAVFIMFRHLAMHDMFHAYRIEELLLKNDWE